MGLYGIQFFQIFVLLFRCWMVALSWGDINPVLPRSSKTNPILVEVSFITFPIIWNIYFCTMGTCLWFTVALKIQLYFVGSTLPVISVSDMFHTNIWFAVFYRVFYKQAEDDCLKRMISCIFHLKSAGFLTMTVKVVLKVLDLGC